MANGAKAKEKLSEEESTYMAIDEYSYVAKIKITSKCQKSMEIILYCLVIVMQNLETTMIMIRIGTWTLEDLASSRRT